MSEAFENSSIQRDLFGLICGERLGSGIAREVWTSKAAPHAVVKLETAADSFQNVLEWEIWQTVKDTELSRWFAPCLHIGGNGSVLVMARTQPATDYPERMPDFLTDFKRANYGMLDGRFVCHDYGVSLLMNRGLSRRMRKVEWWDL